MRFSDIPTQNDFRVEIGLVDAILAEAGYVPRAHYAQINNYRKRHIENYATTLEAYWHKEVGATMNDIHRDYYANDKGDSIHISFEIAENLSERNKVHFGGSSAKARATFKSAVAKLRRLAKAANDELQQLEDDYCNTPAGICDSLDKMTHAIKDELCDLVESRRNENHYRQIQKSSGSDRTQYYFEQWRTGAIGRVTYTSGNIGWKGNPPVMPDVSTFFEDGDIQAQAQDIIAKLAPMQERFRIEVVEEWETQEILKRLKGETAENVPF